MTTIEDARQQEKVLREAAVASPVMSLKAALRARANEWRAVVKACHDAEGDEVETFITPAGALEPGQLVYDGGGTAMVVRFNWAGGIPSVLVREADTGRERWCNTTGASTPFAAVMERME